MGGHDQTSPKHGLGPFTGRQLTVIVCVAIVAIAVVVPTAALAASGAFTSTTVAPAAQAVNVSGEKNAIGLLGRVAATGNVARTGVVGSATGSNGIGVKGTGEKYAVYSDGPLGVAAGKPLHCAGCVGPDALSPLSKGTMFAIVNLNGTLRRGTPGATSTLAGGAPTGDYVVTFPRSVATCAWVASVTGTADATTPLDGALAVALSNSANGVYVQGRNAAGTEAERPFTLIVSCP
jgi:hypothetical protein